MATSQDQMQLMKCAHAPCNCLIPQGEHRYCSPQCAKGEEPCQCHHRECAAQATG